MNDRPELHGSSTENTALADALLAWLGGDPAGLDTLEPDDRAAARDLQPWLALLADHSRNTETSNTEFSTVVPPTQNGQAGPDGEDPAPDDPIAIALGLVADPERRLDSKRLTRARQTAGLKASELARRLTARGWGIAAKDVAHWERAQPSLPPAIVAALADILGVLTNELMPNRAISEPRWLAEFLTDDRIAREMQAWADDRNLSITQIRRHFADSLASAGYRERQAPTVDALLAVIAVLRRQAGPGSGTR